MYNNEHHILLLSLCIAMSWSLTVWWLVVPSSIINTDLLQLQFNVWTFTIADLPCFALLYFILANEAEEEMMMMIKKYLIYPLLNLNSNKCKHKPHFFCIFVVVVVVKGFSLKKLTLQSVSFGYTKLNYCCLFAFFLALFD